MRKKLLAANWKMHKSRDEISSFFAKFDQKFRPAFYADVELLIAPSFVHLSQVIGESSPRNILVGSQNCHNLPQGAYTGEVSWKMLLDLGVSAAIVGHSERRQYFGESSELVAEKVTACLDHGLQPIMCIGETLAERESGITEKIISDQISALLSKTLDLRNLVIAYEPVWAIGTGKTATAEQAQAVHKFIRDTVRSKCSSQADQVQIIYGGSVKSTNIRELITQPDIDGALIGGASLAAEDFAAIIQECVSEVSKNSQKRK